MINYIFPTHFFASSPLMESDCPCIKKNKALMSVALHLVAAVITAV